MAFKHLIYFSIYLAKWSDAEQNKYKKKRTFFSRFEYQVTALATNIDPVWYAHLLFFVGKNYSALTMIRSSPAIKRLLGQADTFFYYYYILLRISSLDLSRTTTRIQSYNKSQKYFNTNTVTSGDNVRGFVIDLMERPTAV